MLRKIWLATWNCENQFPPDDMIRGFIPAEMQRGGMLAWPDVIAIGVQEGEPSHAQKRAAFGFQSSRPQWLSEHVAAMLNQYESIGSHHLAGSTKGPVNFQQLGILVRRGVTVSDLRFDDYRGSLSGKGGIVCSLSVDRRRIGIISAHLDASTADRRRENLNGLVCKVAKLQPGARGVTDLSTARVTLRSHFDAVFLMGDLNYRLKPPGTVLSPNALSELIASPDGLEQLWSLDTLNASLRSDSAWYGFEFPKPSPLFNPTYKREYRTRGPNNPSLVFARNRTAANARAAYFAHVDPAAFGRPLDIAKRGEYDLGWLDRVGWVSGHGAHVSCEQFVDFPELVLSDHTPVLMKIDLR
jgi:endonuclease/exonuclease/phosphatase family metal-dependent hydrolase